MPQNEHNAIINATSGGMVPEDMHGGTPGGISAGNALNSRQQMPLNKINDKNLNKSESGTDSYQDDFEDE